MIERIFYTSGEMAAMCGVHPRTWCKWVSKGYAPKPVYVGPAPRWRVCDIEKWNKALGRKALQTNQAIRDMKHRRRRSK